jgi:NAD(P)-dependent dehydrogenase (short-subunit alcohol dehydrogenase family)
MKSFDKREVFDKKYTPSKKLLCNRVIAVTGAGSGIGRVVAKTYAEYGATVILLGRTSSKLESLYDEIDAENLPQAAIYVVDFNSAVEKDYLGMAEALSQQFGRLDGIVHNAAILGQRTPLRNYSADTWQSVFQVNVTAPFMMTKSLLPLLQKSDNASVIFTGSSVGYSGRAYWGAYAASKAAVENLMQTLADELDNVSTIRSNSINPGATRTSMRATAYPGENPDMVKPAAMLMPLYLYLMGADSVDSNGKQFVI